MSFALGNNMDKFLKTAIEAAKEAGKIQLERRGNMGKICYKGDINIVTEVDLLCEKKIVKIIKDNYPEHSILTEEKGETLTGSDYKWIIDPIDGTTNYAHDFPCYCSSIALELKGEIVLCAVYQPVLDELFFAQKGKGAFLNRHKIHVSKTKTLLESLLATGFAYDVHESEIDNMDHFTDFIKKAQSIRRPGSAVLDLCYVALGRFDGFWELKLQPWDVAAGILLIEEAGGKVTGISGEKYSIYSKNILASNGFIHQDMINVLNC